MKKQTGFTARVLTIVKKIPKGNTMSYKAVARKAGNEKAARAVGMIMSKNTDTNVPCHRVIRSDGALGGYNGLRGTKQKLLKKEGTI